MRRVPPLLFHRWMTSKERDRGDQTARQGVLTMSEDEESLKDRVGRR